ncbi:MAG: RDD family protein [Alphaproteobacteria bacterium]|nr:RDD family protein [Alphaproteobacteria bacterium]
MIAVTSNTSASAEQQRLATGWQRLGACVLDMIVCAIPYYIFSILVTGLYWQSIFYLFSVTVYYIVTETYSQATWGKRLVKIYVAQKSLSKPTFLSLAWRYFVWLFPGIPMCYFLIKPEFIELAEMLKNTDDPHAKAQLLQLPIVASLMKNYMISIAFSLVAGLVFYWIPGLATKERTGLHDWLSGTRVYQGKPQPTPSIPSTPDAAA